MKLPTLYSLSSKKKTQVWSIHTENDEVVTVHGVLGGALQENRKKINGKNIGKSNETTPQKQAELTAQRTWKTKVEKGYVESLEELSTPFLPMLAKDFNENQSKVKYPCCVQPKLDGIRCMAYWEGNELVLRSRAGKPLNVPHIKASLESKLHKNGVLDGELYIHGKNFQEITRLVKKVRPESIELEYHVYDGFLRNSELTPFRERCIQVQNLLVNPEVPDDSLPQHVILVESRYASSIGSVNTIYSQMIDDGYEGAIIRNYDGVYKLKHRSSDLLKLKSFKDGEYQVVDFGTGVGKFEGTPIWRCVTDQGFFFDVVCKGSLDEKKEEYANAHDRIGQWLKVKYFELSEDGIPRFPVGLGFRMQEDM